MTAIASVVLAAGQGTRMRSSLPKVLHEVGGLPMLGHVLNAAAALGAARQVVVVGAMSPRVGAAAGDLAEGVEIAVQDPPRGTADAVSAALPKLEGFEGIVLVLYADTPLVTAETLGRMARAIDDGAALAVLGFEPDEPGAYGRLVTDGSGALDRIVEAKDASADELAVRLCNAGVMAVRSDVLRALLPRIGNRNAKSEFYLTDLVGLARGAGERAAVVKASAEEVSGVNDRAELAAAEGVFQRRARLALALAGVTLRDPATLYLSHDTQVGQDVVIGQNVVVGPGVRIESGARVEAFCHLEGCVIEAGASVGPFARLRPGTKVGKGAKVGNFVEAKKAVLGEGAKVGHLTYLGDAEVGADVNIGAGTITCNYDGYEKHVTRIGARAFIGSNSSLVAPVTVGEGAYVGSGSVVTDDVRSDALALARGRQVEKPGWAVSFRERKEK
ncbi:bifunctional UDP-N-acetylglucosamine diphosphorylase/glucosamine-1-phosphate N-acetyltransferase GlmU [Parvularcula dongshanensis]|uniref:Bifunctional protein GlmU n=1 Tax=Parvularcula dongshanensis TaxID=1173995 RepID=A0A840I0T4_9PROT|nr:bifunctional UDP-N-acetylglucosamine diphosphorylase/glucosamine-1-phosphate N-acetyltransferase GlmU [Parvularcula dongshanensis]MBB4658439.1 bifunctional UDP-N-acetylglucosamine pyrophosphorylase/glucosamine-1-phosphate N-acetyltransferase [Parvularcula dongshanensis]